jgi:mRNA interferase YafQ
MRHAEANHGRTTRFKKDFRRGQRQLHKGFDDLFDSIVEKLANDVPLDAKYRDHSLSGEYNDCRDCHLRPDLVLIYLKTEMPQKLTLVRLGSHNELFGA